MTKKTWLCSFLVLIAIVEIESFSNKWNERFLQERKVAGILSDLVAKTEVKLDKIRKYLQDYERIEQENAVSEEDFTRRVAGNPIHTYRMVKRIVLDWDSIDSIIHQDDWQSAAKRIDELNFLPKPPKEVAIEKSAKTIIKMQNMYELNITALSAGNFLGVETRAGFDPEDCLYFGQVSIDEGLYARAVEWFERCFEMVGSGGNPIVTHNVVNDYIRHATQMHDNAIKGIGVVPEFTFLKLLEHEPARQQRITMLQLERNYTTGSKISPRDYLNNYHALCRGEQIQNKKTTARMKCWNDGNKHPFFRLMPVKTEQQSDDPEIYHLYDVISDREIDTVKEFSKNQLTVSTTVDGARSKVSLDRISSTAHIDESEHPIFAQLSQRISMLTGLLTDHSRGDAENLQVANYGAGGHYNFHQDYMAFWHMNEEQRAVLDQEDLGKGDRIATFMFYLNDVDLGGRTAFPIAGVSLKPVKGSAAFWWNLKRNGEPHQGTLHGACPVILGNKWISTKWIREKNQAFRRPCLTTNT